MTTEIKCAKCPTTVQRVFGPDEDTTAPWLCPECDSDEGEVPIEDESEIFGSEEQLREADSFNGEHSNAPYIRYLEAEGLLDDHFPDDPPAPTVMDRPGGWFEEHAGLPTRAEIAFTEKRLRKHGLAGNQLYSQQDIVPVIVPVIEGTELQGGIQQHQFDRGLNGETWHVDARDSLDGDELDYDHEVRTREHERQIPAWALDDRKLRQVVLGMFPRHATNKRQRAMAGRWLRIVYLFFRANWWTKNIAGTTGCTVRAVEGIIRRAREAGGELFGAASSSASPPYEGDWCCSELKKDAGSAAPSYEEEYAWHAPDLKAA